MQEVDWQSNSQPPKSQFCYAEKMDYIRFIQNRDYDSDSYKTYIPKNENLTTVDRLDILIDKYGDAGTVRYGIQGVFNVALAKLSVKNINCKEYIRSFFLSKSIYSFLHNSCMASTRASLSEENLKHISVVIPSKLLLEKYEKYVCNMRYTILKNKDENQELSSLRDFLLPLLMNGQVTFNEEKESVENHVKQAVVLSYIERFNLWKQNQGYVARGEVDDEVLKKIFDAMDENDKK